jgi:hypothetical protein
LVHSAVRRDAYSQAHDGQKGHASNPAQDQAGDAATKAILHGNSADLMALRQYIPAAADQLAAFNLRDSARAKPSVALYPEDTSSGSLEHLLRESQ